MKAPKSAGPWGEITSPVLAKAAFTSGLVRRCALIKEMRIARTRGMRNPTWTAFSSPVFDLAGNFRMVLTVIGVTSLFDTRLDGSVAQSLKATAERLSASLVI